MLEHFSALLGVSLGGAAGILLLALWGKMSRTRYGAKWRCWVWLVLCIRLMIPISLMDWQKACPVQIKLPQDAAIHAPPVIPERPDESPELPVISDSEPEVRPGKTPTHTPQPFTPSKKEMKIPIAVFRMAFWVWVVGAAVCMGWAIFSHLRFLYFLKRWSCPVTRPETEQLYLCMARNLHVAHRPVLRICSGLQAPMLAGLICPVLLLPDIQMSEETLRYILLHELIHYKRKDILLKALALLVSCLHWFNPLMWYMLHLVERDTELACDEMAMEYLSPEEYKRYGQVILDAAERTKQSHN